MPTRLTAQLKESHRQQIEQVRTAFQNQPTHDNALRVAYTGPELLHQFSNPRKFAETIQRLEETMHVPAVKKVAPLIRLAGERKGFGRLSRNPWLASEGIEENSKIAREFEDFLGVEEWDDPITEYTEDVLDGEASRTTFEYVEPVPVDRPTRAQARAHDTRKRKFEHNVAGHLKQETQQDAKKKKHASEQEKTMLWIVFRGYAEEAGGTLNDDGSIDVSEVIRNDKRGFWDGFRDLLKVNAPAEVFRDRKFLRHVTDKIKRYFGGDLTCLKR